MITKIANSSRRGFFLVTFSTGLVMTLPASAVAQLALLAITPILAGLFGLWAVKASKTNDLEMRHLDVRYALALKDLETRHARELVQYQTQMQKELKIHEWRLAVMAGTFANNLTAEQQKVLNEYGTKMLLANLDGKGTLFGTADGRIAVGRRDFIETMTPGEAEVVGIQAVRERERVAVPVDPRFRLVTDEGLQKDYLEKVKSMRDRANPQLQLSSYQVVGTRRFSQMPVPRDGNGNVEMVALRSNEKDQFGRYPLSFEALG